MGEVFDIEYQGRRVGRLEVRREGLMTALHAETEPLNGVLRLSLRCAGRLIPAGVMSPSGGRLHLCRSFSRNALAELGVSEIEGAELTDGRAAEPARWQPCGEPWRVFSDAELAASCRGARGVLRLGETGAVRLAFPFSAEAPFSLMPAFCVGEPRTINGRCFLVFTLKNGELLI